MIRRWLSGVALAILPSMALLIGSAAAQEKPAEPEPYKPVTWKNGLQYRSEDGDVQFRLGGYLQADGWFFLDDQDNLETDSFFIRRARIIMEASFWKRFEFRFMPDFARGSTSIYDAYIDIKANYSSFFNQAAAVASLAVRVRYIVMRPAAPGRT